MTDSLSITTALDSASWPVVLIMIALVGLSCFSWTIIIKKYLFFINIKRYLQAFETTFWSGIEFIKLHKELQQNNNPKSGLEYIFNAGFNEFSRQDEDDVIDSTKLAPSVKQAIRISLITEQKKLEESLPMLASIGSITPYIGLLGTVLGIISAFFGLAIIQQPSLKVIAPGIAEALITTALGLVVAIPAIFFYNRLMVKADHLMSYYESFAEEFYAILQRKLDISNKQ